MGCGLVLATQNRFATSVNNCLSCCPKSWRSASGRGFVLAIQNQCHMIPLCEAELLETSISSEKARRVVQYSARSVSDHTECCSLFLQVTIV